MAPFLVALGQGAGRRRGGTAGRVQRGHKVVAARAERRRQQRGARRDLPLAQHLRARAARQPRGTATPRAT
jgi:hypothetical protein